MSFVLMLLVSHKSSTIITECNGNSIDKTTSSIAITSAYLNILLNHFISDQQFRH